jgi:hypothetical protein
MSQCVKGLWLGPAESPHNRGGPRDTAAGHYQGLGTLLLSVSRREEAYSTGWFEETSNVIVVAIGNLKRPTAIV